MFQLHSLRPPPGGVHVVVIQKPASVYPLATENITERCAAELKSAYSDEELLICGPYSQSLSSISSMLSSSMLSKASGSSSGTPSSTSKAKSWLPTPNSTSSASRTTDEFIKRRFSQSNDEVTYLLQLQPFLEGLEVRP